MLSIVPTVRASPAGPCGQPPPGLIVRLLADLSGNRHIVLSFGANSAASAGVRARL